MIDLHNKVAVNAYEIPTRIRERVHIHPYRQSAPSVSCAAECYLMARWNGPPAMATATALTTKAPTT